MTAGDADTVLSRLEGFLKAFAWFNSKTNHGCSFDVYQIPKVADVPAALAAYFKLPPSNFRVEPLAEFERELGEVFAHFLFLFREPVGGDPYGDYLVDPRQSFALMDEYGQQGLFDELAGVVRSLGTSAAWRLVASLECGELREWCFQEDVVLELPDRLCLLHFGVSD
jgi:hypothetical protein